jgi:RNA polymerase sigma factor (sigma-70 family)
MAPPYKPQQGDEAELFKLYNERLMRRVRATVSTTPQIVEDACALAWVQFLRYQPDRERGWRSWLFQTARREAWRLHGERYETRTVGSVKEAHAVRSLREPVDPRNRHDERLELLAAGEVLEQLPPRLRRIAFLRAAGLRYSEIGELTGDSPTRVNQLVTRANHRIHEILAAETSRTLPPRAQRLRDLEENPPAWLTAEIGQVPRSQDRRASIATRLLNWRRAALALDDYRKLTGFNAGDRGLGDRPIDPTAARAFDVARRAVDNLYAARSIARERD